MASPAKTTDRVVSVNEMEQRTITIKIVGTTGMYYNAMSIKAQRTLLFPAPKTSGKKTGLKHDPIQEFGDSIYRQTNKNADTYLGFPAAGIKGAMATAALETPEITKSSVNRLIYLPQDRVNIWGIPYLRMDIVRQAGINKTPDVRTRAFLPEWCSEVTIKYIVPNTNTKSIYALLMNAGMVCGIGDFRIEKGKGGYGGFRIAPDDDQEWADIAGAGGYEAQKNAMENPETSDIDTDELLEWFKAERMGTDK